MQRFMNKLAGRMQRHRRIRAHVQGTADRPRLSVFRSAMHCTAQVIDDAAGRTIAAASDRDVTVPKDAPQRKVAIARAVGTLLAERARVKGVTKVVFDRSGYAYHGRVEAVADGARAGGIEF